VAAKLLPVDDVIADLLSGVNPIQETRFFSLSDASGRYLASDITSAINVPPGANSAMDGYAVNSANVVKGGLYDISDRIAAGSVGGPLVAGTAARIFTGAQIPPDADAVVMQEDTEIVGDQVKIGTSVKPGKNVRPKGQDIAVGDTILNRGRRIQPQDLGLLASVGNSQVEIFRPLRIGLMSTGDELVEPPNPLKPGQIYNSNHYALGGLVNKLGMEVVDLGVVEDTPEATIEALTRGAQLSDCIISTGGVSVGEEDYVKGAVETLGRLDVWRLAIKPGKPLAFGNVLGTPFFGLPGNPVSMFVTFLIIAKPYLIALQGGADAENKFLIGEADFDFQAGTRREYLRAQVHLDNNRVVLKKFSEQGSGVMSSVSWADALVEVEMGRQVKRGDSLRYCLL
jgi:molybdopterin molybdotransferase